MEDNVERTDSPVQEEEVSDRIITVPNVISSLRLIMAFACLAVLLCGNNILATVLFGITAFSDCLDGQIARRTHSVSRLGQILDPAVDRVLMICAVVGLLIVGRLPVWVVVLVIARDLLLVGGGAWLLRAHGIRIPVIYPGKVATTFLFIGMAGLILNMPLLPGMGFCDISWLPGFNSAPYSWGIWFIYIGLAIAIVTTVYYVYQAVIALRRALSERPETN